MDTERTARDKYLHDADLALADIDRALTPPFDIDDYVHHPTQWIAHIGDLLVGFKWIAQAIDQYGPDLFIYGTEESHGYMAGSYARDKDGAVAGFYWAVVETLPRPVPGQGLPTLPGPKPQDYHFTTKTDSTFVFDVAEDMSSLTLRVVGRALFSTDLADQASTVGQALTLALKDRSRRTTSFRHLLHAQ